MSGQLHKPMRSFKYEYLPQGSTIVYSALELVTKVGAPILTGLLYAILLFYIGGLPQCKAWPRKLG
eukprot:11687809-Ditylum_brightwellii.AAC.1